MVACLVDRVRPPSYGSHHILARAIIWDNPTQADDNSLIPEGKMPMMRWNSSVIATAIIVLGLGAASAMEPPPPPAPGSPGIYSSQTDIAAALKAAIAKAADPAVSTIGNTNEYAIHEVRRVKDGAPAIHPGWTELHFILEGSATFVTGGKINPQVATGPGSIEGGVSQQVKKGDAIIVPPNTPHAYYHITEPVTYLEVRVISPSATTK
jgi:mannose-6-phosphate isomerase-like protein (cupin superfamily)